MQQMSVTTLANLALPLASQWFEVSIVAEGLPHRPAISMHQCHTPRSHVLVGPWLWLNFSGIWRFLQCWTRKCLSISSKRS
jgi:hypothetical protein